MTGFYRELAIAMLSGGIFFTLGAWAGADITERRWRARMAVYARKMRERR